MCLLFWQIRRMLWTRHFQSLSMAAHDAHRSLMHTLTVFALELSPFAAKTVKRLVSSCTCSMGDAYGCAFSAWTSPLWYARLCYYCCALILCVFFVHSRFVCHAVCSSPGLHRCSAWALCSHAMESLQRVDGCAHDVFSLFVLQNTLFSATVRLLNSARTCLCVWPGRFFNQQRHALSSVCCLLCGNIRDIKSLILVRIRVFLVILCVLFASTHSHHLLSLLFVCRLCAVSCCVLPMTIDSSTGPVCCNTWLTPGQHGVRPWR